MRVTTSKSKNSESFYINYAYTDKNGKSTSKIYKKLGTLKELSEKLGTDRDGVMAWAKKQAHLATIAYEKENNNWITWVDGVNCESVCEADFLCDGNRHGEYGRIVLG